MAILKKREIRNMSKEERDKRLSDLQTELLRMNTLVAGGGTIESPGRINELKRTIARIKTINREEELGIKN